MNTTLESLNGVSSSAVVHTGDAMKVMQQYSYRLVSLPSLAWELMKNKILQQLTKSLESLSVAIAQARSVAEGLEQPPADLLNRLDNYEKILLKQEKLTSSLSENLSFGDWSAVAREIKLISALSRMIRDDALEVLAMANPRAGQPQQSLDSQSGRGYLQ